MANGAPGTSGPERRCADVVIVGAGIAGLGLAAQLCGRKRILVLDRESHPGMHATGRSAAVFVPNYGNDLIRALTQASAADFHQPDPALWDHPLLRPRGLLRLASPEGAAAYDAQLSDARGFEDISLDEAQELFPILDPRRFVRASYEANVFDIDVHALMQGWLRAAKRAGAEALFDAEISRVSRDDDGWQVTTTRGIVDAPVLVDAAGAWADDVARLAGVEPLGLKPLRRSMAVVDLPNAIAGTDRWPFVVVFPLDWYAKPDAGRLLVSPGDEDPVEPHDAFADDMVIAEGLHRFELDVTMPVERVTRTWAGLRTYAPDSHPAVGFDRHAPGFFWLAGQGGFGVQTAPALSRLAAALLCGENAGELDGSVKSQVSPARFG